MKFLTSFDSNYGKRIIAEQQEKFGKEKVVALQRSKSYAWLHIYLLMVVIGSIAGLIIMIAIEYNIPYVDIIIYLGIIATAIPFFTKFKKRINYKYDLILITPEEIIKFDQIGLLSRNINKFNAQRIKSTFIKRSGRINGLLNTGTIIFTVDEGSEEGSLDMDHVNDIESKQQKINAILGLQKGG